MNRETCKTASWVIVELETNRVIFETYNAHLVDTLNTARYKAVPILEYLESLNARAEVD